MQISYGGFVEGLVTERVVDLVLPGAFYPCEDLLIWNVLDLGHVVVIGIVLENHSLDQILASAQPTFLLVLKDNLEPSLGTCDVTGVGDGNAQRSCQPCESPILALQPAAFSYLAVNLPNKLLDV